MQVVQDVVDEQVEHLGSVTEHNWQLPPFSAYLVSQTVQVVQLEQEMHLGILAPHSKQNPDKQ